MSRDDLQQASWFKSSHSNSENNCVEVAFLDSGRIGLRDSKNKAGPALMFAPDQWDVFLGGIVDGEFS